jgi:hypothetical protein
VIEIQFYERCDICKEKTNDFITYKKDEEDTPHIICRECAKNIADLLKK